MKTKVYTHPILFSLAYFREWQEPITTIIATTDTVHMDKSSTGKHASARAVKLSSVLKASILMHQPANVTSRNSVLLTLLTLNALQVSILIRLSASADASRSLLV